MVIVHRNIINTSVISSLYILILKKTLLLHFLKECEYTKDDD